MSNVIFDKFAPASAISGKMTVKRLNPVNSFEDAVKARVRASNKRVEQLQDSGDYYTADRELAYADGLMRALKIYQEWCI